jgi:hypothetical protein
VKAVSFAATVVVGSLCLAAHSMPGHASTIFDYTIQNGTWSGGTFSGTIAVENNAIISAGSQIFVQGGAAPATAFTLDTANGANMEFNDEYDVHFSEGNYILFLGIDNVSPDFQLFNGLATPIDSTQSDLTLFTGVGIPIPTFVGGSFGADLVPVPPTPLPAALPLFAGGLAFVGYLARRKKRAQAIAA